MVDPISQQQQQSNRTELFKDPESLTENAASEQVLELDGVTRTFGDDVGVKDLSLSVYEGELLTLLGPSGCGKTTTLRLLAGLERPDSGTISVRGDVVAGNGEFVQPNNRDIGLIFQDFALFPHLSVGENIAYGIQDRSSDEIDRRIEELLELVDMPAARGDAPDTLSGGQRQRVALARSLAPKPDVLLLDEPFSNLDVGLRKAMREDVRRILTEAGVTAISVTHDQEEALSMSDRVAVINNGQLKQVGHPESVFQTPESRFVAEFLGQANFVSGTLVDGQLETALGSLDTALLEQGGPDHTGANVDILVRPHTLRLTSVGESGVGTETGAGSASASESATTSTTTTTTQNDGESEPKSENAGKGEGEGESESESVANGRIIHRQYTGPSFVYRVELESGDVVECKHTTTERFDLNQDVRVELTADRPLAWFPST